MEELNIALALIDLINMFKRQKFDKLSAPFLVLPALIKAVMTQKSAS